MGGEEGGVQSQLARMVDGEELDFMLTPVNATPAVPHCGMKEAVSACGYTFLFNLVSLPS